MRRRDFLKAAAIVPLAAPSLALGADKRVLRYTPQADLSVLDPIWTTATVTRNHAFLVFDTLYGQDNSYKAVPQMAEGATTENDGKLWKITLRPGLKFHDGTAVLAKDCVASIQRWGKRDAYGQTLLAATDELSAPDDRTIQFRLRRPFPLLPDALAKCTAFPPVIMPERLAKTDAFAQVTEMVGSGPYRFLASERMVGARAVYERFADYKPREAGKPEWTSGPKIVNFDRVEWITIPDTATAASALQTGEIDWLEQPAPDLQPMLAKDKTVKVVNNDPTGAVAILRMNQLLPPFDNPAIRRAILGAVSQEDYMVAVAGNDDAMWKTGIGVFPPGCPLENDAGMEVLNGPRDYEKVKRDLKAGGYNGEKIVILGVTDLANLKAEGDVGSDMLRRCGMNVDYQTMDWGTVVARRAKKEAAEQGGWNIFFTGWNGIDMFNPIGHLSLRGNGLDAWFGWPTAPKIEELRTAWIEAPDLETQKKLAREIQKQVLTDVPYIPLGQYYLPVAFKTYVEGTLTGFPVFWNVRKV
ncbi:peptide/nickel transport system substrate-binding protein [Rhizobiales bacterium GAS191]|nr:peptide/nickel transport system substrate-binding protein [Rhizobiales bacterium GAS191]